MFGQQLIGSKPLPPPQNPKNFIEELGKQSGWETNGRRWNVGS